MSRWSSLLFYFATLVCISANADVAAPSGYFDDRQWTMIDDIIKNQRPQSVDEFLGLLPESFKKSFVLLDQSIGLQQATPENPRVIMYSPNAEVVLSFNGHPSQRGYSGLEVIRFNSRTLSYDLFEIKFPRDQEPAVQDIKVEQNPEACLRCHGTGGLQRPIWEPYPFWPRTVTPTDFIKPEEQLRLESYALQMSKLPRYRVLNFRGMMEQAKVTEELFISPAFAISTRFSTQNNARTARRMTIQFGSHSRHPYGVMGALAACPNMHSFFPATASWNRPEPRAQAESFVRTQADKLLAPHRFLFTYNRPAKVRAVADLVWLEKGLGLDLSFLGNSFQAQALGIPLVDATGTNMAYILEQLLLDDLGYPMNLRDFLKIFSTYEIGPGYQLPADLQRQHDEVCGQLARLSLDSFR